MTPERHRQITELYHAALEVDPKDRPRFLERECADDIALRLEVESLLASCEQAPDFISAPAFEVAAELLARQTDDLIGQMIARYRVVSLLGAGGMGQVYLADDTILGRQVALKLLPEHFTHDKHQVKRFRQEARAASALNHPNILTVHEVGQLNNTEFIATEYVQGETLRERLTHPFRVRETLDIAVQVADALVAAHEAGIIHRDIKPENIMLRRDGYVKVLDFGLAKLLENFTGQLGSELSTQPGMVRGTIPYMSPEQARGLPVDARADLWSLGVVLYEMVSGRRPFSAATPSDTLVAILEREPPSLLVVMPETPAELDRIVMKALTKERDERYQNAKDLAIDLKRLRRQLDVDAEIERSHPSGSVSQRPTTPLKTADTRLITPRSSEGGATLGTSSVEYLFKGIAKHRTIATLVGVVLVILIGLLGYRVYRVLKPVSLPATAFQTIRMTRLTASGNVTNGAISPDGKYAVYVEDNKKQQSLWVRQIATGSTAQLVPAAPVTYSGLTFSNDSNYIYYATNVTNEQIDSLYQVPSLGGAAKRIAEHVDSAITFSPDGSRFAFLRANPGQGETAILTMNTDGSGERTLAVRKMPDFFWYEGLIRISWSPDGKLVACAAVSTDNQGQYFTVVGVSVEDGSQKVLTARQWPAIYQVSWLSDGSGLLMVAKETEVSPSQLWFLSYPGGEARRITNDLNHYADVSLTANSNTLVTLQSNRNSNIWIAPEGDVQRATQITFGTADSSLGLAWSPDGRIFYQSDKTGKSEIWVMNADGSNQQQLTQEGSNYRPAISLAGSHVVWHSFRNGKSNLWRMDLDGGNARQLTNCKQCLFPDISPDGKWVVYASPDAGDITLWKIPIDGGKAVQLSAIPANLPTISPDGNSIASFYFDQNANPDVGIMVLPFSGGKPSIRFKAIPDAINGFALHWSPDGLGVLYFDQELSNLLTQPLNGGKPNQLTRFQGEQLFNFAWSHDGKRLALARGRVADDLVLITDAR
jgi:serine/threonine protein kinase/Tol biopolymer transport system component